jgi:hypothetical protein
MQLPDFGPTIEDYWSGAKAIVYATRWWLTAWAGAFVLGVVLGALL